MTYKQEVKELSRSLLWKHAVDSLTTNRDRNRIFNAKYIQQLWDYVFEETLIRHGVVSSANERLLDDWFEFAGQTYGAKKPAELKVAYLCGPEPENDLNAMIELGIRIENVYAFESDKKYFEQAVDSIRNAYPTLKIFHGKLEDFLSITPVLFDIIYLDFTAPLFSDSAKPYVTLHSVFDHQALSEIGILITNYSFPDKTVESIEFLESYFLNPTFAERNIFYNGGGSDYTTFVTEQGIYKRQEIRQYIDDNFWHAYSAFCTQYPLLYANLVQPAFRVLKNPLAKRRLFETNTAIMEATVRKFHRNVMPNEAATFSFLTSLGELNSNVARGWLHHFNTNIPVQGISRTDALITATMAKDAAYGNYFDILSASLKKALPEILDAIPDKQGSWFCDLPMIHLWLELAINQLGYPYHPNVDNHKRYNYVARERHMCLDVFTFDRCRALYDWLPMIEYYGQDLSNIDRQMLTRICLDAINKHTIYNLHDLYVGSAVMSLYEKKWAPNYSFPDRTDLNAIWKPST